MKKGMKAILLAGIALSTYSAPALAQAPDAESGTGVGEIIITAQKRTERINDVGISITALTGNAMERQNITNVSDLVSGVLCAADMHRDALHHRSA